MEPLPSHTSGGASLTELDPSAPADWPARLSAHRFRIASVDAYRGFVMLLMLAEVLRACDVAAALGGVGIWWSICRQQTHAAWTGCSLHDLIPSVDV